MKLAGAFSMILGGLLLLWIDKQPIDPKPDPQTDIVSEAFDKYEQLWRDARQATAKALEDGVLSGAQETRDLEAAANVKAREASMRPLAEYEASSYENWDPAAHAKLLREYQ